LGVSPLRVLMLVAAILLCFSQILAPSLQVFAADIEVYECKDKMGAALAKEMGVEAGILNVYKFDFINKTVSSRTLDSDGNDYEVVGISVGQTTKYTVGFRMDGDNAKWSHAMGDATATITENVVFNRKTRAMHQTLVIAPKPGAPGVPADAKPEAMESDLVCQAYVPKKHKN
jgi:hypothetical protein